MKYLLIIIVAIILGVGSVVFLITSDNSLSISNSDGKFKNLPKSKITNTHTNNSLPRSIEITKLKIYGIIEEVGLDEENKMDVPTNPQNAGWYSLGTLPGNLGSAVIAGHVDTPNGSPAIFYNLSQLRKGDQIKITNHDNKISIFEVTENKIYDFDKFPLQTVFASNDSKRLNLITCDGVFDQKSKNYLKRRVVYTVLKE